MNHSSQPTALRGLRDLEDQMRGPELREGSPGLQMAWSIPFPGVAAIRRNPPVGIVLFALGVALPLVMLAWLTVERDDLVGVALDPTFMTVVAALGLVVVLVRFLAVAEVAHAYRRTPGIGGKTLVATFAMLVLSVPVLIGVYRANEARDVFAEVFADSGRGSLFVPATTGSVAPDDVTNILLFGGDAAPGRWGMRTDTMILVSVDEASGRTSLTSIPRNLTRLQFPPGTPLAEEFPDGYDDLTNALFTYVSARPDLVAHYGRNGLQAEPVALSEALGYSLDIEIDDFALVNMQGFADVIDAVGGVTIDVPAEIALPPSPPGERAVPPTIGPGSIDMDGALAVGYVRTRSGDSDYQRMGRQRQLLAALGSQVSATDALRGFGSVTGVLDDSMRTSLSAGEFSDLLDQLGDNSAIFESVGLAPPIVEPGSPDYARIREVVDAVVRAVFTGSPSGYAS